MNRPVPLYFIDDNPSGRLWEHFGKYGWNFENTAGERKPDVRLGIHSIYKDGKCEIKRKFQIQTKNKLTLETNLLFADQNNDGFCGVLGQGESCLNPALLITVREGYIYICVKGAFASVGIKAQGNIPLKAICDLENGKNTLYIHGKYIGTFDSSSEFADSADFLKFYAEEGSLVNVTVGKTALYTGYFFNEMFISTSDSDALPDYFEFVTDSDSQAEVKGNNSSTYDPYGALLTLKGGSHNALSTNFDRADGKICFELRFFMPEYADGTRFYLCGDKTLYIETRGDAYYSQNGTFLRKYNSSVWQTVRIEANTETGKATYCINDKRFCTESFDGTYFDSFRVECSPGADTTLMLDDIYVYNMFDECRDYVPVPSPVHSETHNIGVEVCDIWRNGFQFGWDYVSGFPELDTYLGKFDEGSTECADWEIKWMCEHAIDFRLVCWYSGRSSSPQKTPRNNFGQKAYMNAKYTDYVKYAIQWENTYNMPKCSDDFRKYFVPYWVEYYLTDDRYFVINNKPLISIYRTTTLIESFGSKEAVKEELDYLRSVCRSLGYDGAIILTCQTNNTEELKEMGFDGSYAYNLGSIAKDPDVQIGQIKKLDNIDGYCFAITVAVGFNTISLYDNDRADIITPEGYEKVLRFVKDDFLPNREVDEEWKKKTVILSNWNEFGEGHYIMPSKIHGFGYVDAVRKVFADNGNATKHTDIKPDEYGRRRFNSLYDNTFRRMRRLGFEDRVTEYKNFNEMCKIDFSDKNEQRKWTFAPMIENGGFTENSIKGSFNGTNYWIYTKEPISFDTSGITHFRVKAKYTNTPGTPIYGKIFFITEDETAWNEDKCARFDTNHADKRGEFYGTFISCNKWFGKITGFRIDPIKAPSDFEIYEISFGTADGNIVKIGDNRINANFEFSPCELGDDLEIVLTPTNKMLAYLGAYAEWYNLEERYVLKNAKHTLEYFIGSSEARFDGRQIQLGYLPALRDGLITVRLRDFEKLGYTVNKCGSIFEIK